MLSNGDELFRLFVSVIDELMGMNSSGWCGRRSQRVRQTFDELIY